MKRFFIILALLLTLFVTSIALFLYLFDINSHSQWLSEQIEKSTGYQISFDSVENRAWQDSSFSIAGLSVGRAPDSVLEIDKITIEIDRLDIWDRHLDLELVELEGIHLHLKQGPLQGRTGEPNNAKSTEYLVQNLPWNKLQINKLRLSDLNVEVSDGQQSLLLDHANLSSDNLLVIDNKKIVTTSFKGNGRFDFAMLEIQSADLTTLKLQSGLLSGDFDLAKLQAKLALSIKQFAFREPNQSEIIADNALLDLQLDKNKLSLTRLFINIFSGELSLQADALLSFHLFPRPVFYVQRLQVLSLLLEDMRLTIPAFMPVSVDNAQSKDNEKMPIETLFIQQVNVHNVDIRSEEKQLPLTVKRGSAAVSNFYLVQNNRLFTELEKERQSGAFTLQADYLQWAETAIEQFDIVASLPQDEPFLLQLKPLVTPQ